MKTNAREDATRELSAVGRRRSSFVWIRSSDVWSCSVLRTAGAAPGRRRHLVSVFVIRLSARQGWDRVGFLARGLCLARGGRAAPGRPWADAEGGWARGQGSGRAAAAAGVSEAGRVWRWGVRLLRGGAGTKARGGGFGHRARGPSGMAFLGGGNGRRGAPGAGRGGRRPAAAGPSLSTLQRAVARVLLPGDRAGPGRAGGGRARAGPWTFLAAPGRNRNAVWEADHV